TSGPWMSSARSPEAATQTVPADPTVNSARSLLSPTRYRTPDGAEATGGVTVTAGIGRGVSGVAGRTAGARGAGVAHAAVIATAETERPRRARPRRLLKTGTGSASRGRPCGSPFPAAEPG